MNEIFIIITLFILSNFVLLVIDGVIYLVKDTKTYKEAIKKVFEDVELYKQYLNLEEFEKEQFINSVYKNIKDRLF